MPSTWRRICGRVRTDPKEWGLRKIFGAFRSPSDFEPQLLDSGDRPHTKACMKRKSKGTHSTSRKSNGCSVSRIGPGAQATAIAHCSLRQLRSAILTALPIDFAGQQAMFLAADNIESILPSIVARSDSATATVSDGSYYDRTVVIATTGLDPARTRYLERRRVRGPNRSSDPGPVQSPY